MQFWTVKRRRKADVDWTEMHHESEVLDREEKETVELNRGW
jgi:hypothetical protein